MHNKIKRKEAGRKLQGFAEAQKSLHRMFEEHYMN